MLHSSLDDGNATPSLSTALSSEPANGVAAARALFQSKSSRGQDKGAGNSSSSSQSVVSQHSRAVTGISVAAGKQTIVTTSSLDGKIILWDLQSVILGINSATMNLQ